MHKYIFYIQRWMLFVLAIFLVSCNEKSENYAPKSIDELEGHTVCVLEGSIQQDYALSHAGDKNITFLSLASSTDCMAMLSQGKADVFFGADLYAYNEAFHRQNLKICAVLDVIEAHFCLKLGIQSQSFKLQLILEEILMETACDSRPVAVDVLYEEKKGTLQMRIVMKNLRDSILDIMTEESRKIVTKLCKEFKETITEDGLRIDMLLP